MQNKIIAIKPLSESVDADRSILAIIVTIHCRVNKNTTENYETETAEARAYPGCSHILTVTLKLHCTCYL